MKRNAIIYWITTMFVALIMGISGVLAFVHATTFMEALAQLGYPSYFSNILGWGKLIGVATLLSRGVCGIHHHGGQRMLLALLVRKRSSGSGTADYAGCAGDLLFLSPQLAQIA